MTLKEQMEEKAASCGFSLIENGDGWQLLNLRGHSSTTIYPDFHEVEKYLDEWLDYASKQVVKNLEEPNPYIEHVLAEREWEIELKFNCKTRPVKLIMVDEKGKQHELFYISTDQNDFKGHIKDISIKEKP